VQGYSFKVVSNLVGAAERAQLQLSSRKERLDLLAKLKSHAEAAEGVEKDADADGLPAKAPMHVRNCRPRALLSPLLLRTATRARTACLRRCPGRRARACRARCCRRAAEALPGASGLLLALGCCALRQFFPRRLCAAYKHPVCVISRPAARVQVHRKVGTLAALSGADATYREFSTGAAAAAGAAKRPSIRKLVASRRIGD
jgi:hypothetical protein